MVCKRFTPAMKCLDLPEADGSKPFLKRINFLSAEENRFSSPSATFQTDDLKKQGEHWKEKPVASGAVSQKEITGLTMHSDSKVLAERVAKATRKGIKERLEYGEGEVLESDIALFRREMDRKLINLLIPERNSFKPSNKEDDQTRPYFSDSYCFDKVLLLAERVAETNRKGFPEKLAHERMQILEIPHDLVECNILHWLPAKSLVRFQLTCKNWMNLFSQTRFIYSHLKNIHNYPSFLHSRNSSEIWMLEDLGQSPRYFRMGNLEGEHIKAISACDGLILVNTFSHRISIWNCNMGECVWLAPREHLSVSDYYCLGRTRDMKYKVLKFNIWGPIDDVIAEIYDLESHRWTPVEMEEDWSCYRQNCFAPVSVQGQSFWLAKRIKGEVFLQSYNYSTETFLPRRLPNVVLKNDNTKTAALSPFRGDKLSLLYQTNTSNTVLWISSIQVIAWKKLLVVTTEHPPLDHLTTSVICSQHNLKIFQETIEETEEALASVRLIEISENQVVETRELHSYNSSEYVPSRSCIYFQSLLPVTL